VPTLSPAGSLYTPPPTHTPIHTPAHTRTWHTHTCAHACTHTQDALPGGLGPYLLNPHTPPALLANTPLTPPPTHTPTHTLKDALRKVVKGVGGLEHTDFRAFRSERRVTECRGFIDGDLVEAFLDLGVADASKVGAAGALPCRGASSKVEGRKMEAYRGCGGQLCVGGQGKAALAHKHRHTNTNTCAHRHTRTHTHTYTRTHTHTHTHTCTYARMHMHTHTHTLSHTHAQSISLPCSGRGLDGRQL